MKIIPAILTDNREEFLKMLEITKEFADYVQIDIMDGKFVPSRSITIDDLKGINFPIISEAHLMVEDPCKWIEPFKEFGAQRIIYHYEIAQDHQKVISRIRSKGLSPGLAVNPSTSIEEFKDLVDEVEMVLFMSVNPGFYGSKFIPQVLEKITQFKKLFPNKRIGIDGGIKLDNLKLVKGLAIDYICVGSAILKNPNPKESYQQFNILLNE
ncbi:MAG: ribulose-phosphate 3-epimerase [Candidatus Omnitrophica bacterium]|nr:ribulose-phosphate 3-epimerase [Candidatus Omnitrophota bacterium]